MASSARVRTHTRRTKSGEQTTVHQHTRRTQGRRKLVSPGHAWKLLRSALWHGRRRRRATAAVLGGLALGELAAWLTLRGVGFMLVTAGVLAIAAAAVMIAAAGGELK